MIQAHIFFLYLGQTKFLIVNGEGTQKPEILDLEGDDPTCMTISDFPKPPDMGVTWFRGSHGLVVGSHIVVCGGDYYSSSTTSVTSSQKCYTLNQDGDWDLFVNMSHGRAFFSSIEYDGLGHVFGGVNQEANGMVASSEVINQDGQTEPGTDLPMPLHSHAMASFNKTHSLLTGGWGPEGYSDKTWYFVHATQEFRPAPPMIMARMSHSIGLIVDHGRFKYIWTELLSIFLVDLPT